LASLLWQTSKAQEKAMQTSRRDLQTVTDVDNTIPTNTESFGLSDSLGHDYTHIITTNTEFHTSS